MALGDHEDVHGRLGVHVPEREEAVVLVDDVGGDLVASQLAENAVAHRGSFHADLRYPKRGGHA